MIRSRSFNNVLKNFFLYFSVLFSSVLVSFSDRHASCGGEGGHQQLLDFYSTFVTIPKERECQQKSQG